MISKLKTAPSVEPVSLIEAKLNLRLAVTSDDALAYTYEDDLLTRLITASREYVEHYTDKCLITQVWELYLDTWPDSNVIKLPKSPLQSVTTIAYTDSDGNTTNFTDFYTDTASEIGRIILNDTASWPSATLREVNGIKITYSVGFGATSSSVPSAAKTAMHLIIGGMYHNREHVVVGVTSGVLQLGVNSMLDTLRLYDGA